MTLYPDPSTPVSSRLRGSTTLQRVNASEIRPSPLAEYVLVHHLGITEQVIVHLKRGFQLMKQCDLPPGNINDGRCGYSNICARTFYNLLQVCTSWTCKVIRYGVFKHKYIHEWSSSYCELRDRHYDVEVKHFYDPAYGIASPFELLLGEYDDLLSYHCGSHFLDYDSNESAY